ncbi:MAG: Eco57I restriction-modification methylase domain-containing protein [Muribaculaceae bacterium]|nr:Eco57I restriction-modification methylase domain-containing protein [Muribaculaceae bacterium]MDE7081104.1 Eco57I restriction-modification methylase domain-containing protein [Muribaculaceae bacterium]
MAELIPHNILDEVVKNTNAFIASVPKSQRKKFGQFFTTAKTAMYMAALFCIDLDKEELSLLDAGAGTGILSAALIDRIYQSGYTGKVNLTCYETDSVVFPVLEQNLKIAKEKYGINYSITTENYITSQYFGIGTLLDEDSSKYDYIIGNPPYLKISKDAPEALSMPLVCHGAPNLYFLFWAMGVYNLKTDQELVYIIPRSWTSGAYFKKFREYLFDNAVITDIHLFESRDKVFGGESVLQETIIVKVKKTRTEPETINITTSSDSEFSDIRKFEAPYHTVVPKNHYVYLITDEKDANVIERINNLPQTLPDIKLKMQTGIIVDFRTREVLRDNMEEGAFPLLYAQHIKDGHVVWPLGKEGEVIQTDHPAYLQENSDFLIVKRFTSKEEKRRLQCGIYLKQRYSQFKYISTQNKVNFVKCDSPCITYGLYVLLNSSLYDAYYRILNGSTQVNSTEINQIPIPSRDVIEKMGRELMHHELTVVNCDKIVDRWIN